MSGLSISGASQGLLTSTSAFDRSAMAVTTAAAQLASPTAPSGNGSDMIDAMVGLQVAASDVKANVVVVRTADEMLGTLLDQRA